MADAQTDPSPEQERLAEFGELVFADVGEVVGQLHRDASSQFVRRQFFRAVFSAIEGSVFFYKQIALEHDRTNHETSIFSSAELELIVEETWNLDDSGKPRARAMELKLPANLRFAFGCLTRAFGIDFQLDVGGAGWQAFGVAQKIRNRLMHPKSAADLFITDEETDRLHRALLWFFAEFDRLANAITSQRGAAE